jgi:hypothetical protein
MMTTRFAPPASDPACLAGGGCDFTVGVADTNTRPSVTTVL